MAPGAIQSRTEAELLIELEGRRADSDPALRSRLVAALVEFVVWAERPTGVVDEETARWLAATLARRGKGSTATARLLARELVAEAHAFRNDALAILADMAAEPRPAGS